MRVAGGDEQLPAILEEARQKVVAAVNQGKLLVRVLPCMWLCLCWACSEWGSR